MNTIDPRFTPWTETWLIRSAERLYLAYREDDGPAWTALTSDEAGKWLNVAYASYVGNWEEVSDAREAA